ncbi:MAG: DUF3536 domain-containing protein [Ilumatobacteraceae bacterium]
MTADAVVVHGHAYQPPRANPKTGTVPVEPTASPFPNWNARITAECYRPNAFARIFDDRGRIVRIVNNFERMSFDLGPTLAHWLALEAPDVHDRIVAGDRVGRTAIAHPFHHSILPFAPVEDAVTELRWGIADFEARFGRRPAGLWFAETAVDERTLALLPPLGISFTVVAPYQVLPAVPAGEVGRWNGPTGPLDLVAYEGWVSHDLAFGNVLSDTTAMIGRMASAAPSGLVVAATDAETFGHHHRFTERGVAHALFDVVEREGLRTGGLEPLLDLAHRARVDHVPPSAWSCAHGIGRWTEHCGCATDGQPGWSQHWRGPLRAALTLLRDHAFEVFLRRGAEVFSDPLAARNDFGEVLARPGAWTDFVRRHVRSGADPAVARLLLDSQEATLASFTSCAWFFADLARREVVIVMQEAQRSAELLSRLGEIAPVARALDLLAQAQSNQPSVPTGVEVWQHAADGDGVLPHEVSTSGRELLHASVLEPLLLELVTRGLAGEETPVEQACELIELAARGGERLPLDRAQEALWPELEAGRLAPTAAPLARILGFAPR